MNTFLNEKCTASQEPPPVINKDPDYQTITNKFRMFLGLTSCDKQAFYDRRRRQMININNDSPKKHNITITSPHDAPPHLLITEPPNQVALINFYSCIKCKLTFNNKTIAYACKIICGGIT